MNPRRAGAAVLLVATLALTGCGRAETSGPVRAASASATGTRTAVATTAPADAGASASDTGLDGISKDLDAADSANAQTDTDQQAADQAATSTDD